MPKQLFKEGDIVLAKDSGKHYGAKILRAQCFSNAWKYFIHFQQWNRKWDKWVDEGCLQGYAKELDDQLKKRNPAAKTKRLSIDCKNNDSSINNRTNNSLNTSLDEAKNLIEDEVRFARKRRKQLAMEDLCDEADDNTLSIMSKLQIPASLKKHMVDEWELITREPRHLLVLPRPVPVATLIERFLDEKLPKMNENQHGRYRDLFIGLRVYFDKALPVVLLYRHEQLQYDEFRHKHKNILPSSYYGAEHLLRLYAKIPKLLSTVSVPQHDLNFMQSKLCDLLKFLQKRQAEYFCTAAYYKNDGDAIIENIKDEGDSA